MDQSVIDSYSQIGERYDSVDNVRSMWGDIGDALVSQIVPRGDWHAAADIGCGTGTSLSALWPRLPATTRVTGVEPADGMRAVAEAAFAGNERVTILPGAFETLPLEDASLDYLFSLWAFHWSTNPQAAVAEMARVLKPQGDIDLYFVGRHNGGRFSKIMGEVFARHLSWEERLGTAEHMQPYDRASCEALFARFGSAVTVTETFHEVVAPVDQHLAWLIRMESQFAALPPDTRAIFDRELKAALAEIETDGGVPYVGHVLHVRVEGARRTDRGAAASGASAGFLEGLEGLSPALRADKARAMIRRHVSELLGEPLSAAHDDKGLRALGLGSMDAVALSQRLSAVLGRAVPNTVLFGYPTIAALAAYALGEETDRAAEPRTAAARAVTAPVPRQPEGAVEPIAIIGMSARFPGSDGLDGFADFLMSGRDGIGPVPPERWATDGDYPAPPLGGFLDGIEDFDAALFRIGPAEARQLDPQHRMMLEGAWRALENAGIAPDSLTDALCGVYAGVATHDQMLRLQRRPLEETDAHTVLGTMPSVAAGRVSYTLGLRGPAIAVDTACSSSLVAIHTACQALRAGDIELAIAGGVNVLLSPEYTLALTAGEMLAPDGRCKAFDSRADGFVRAEGCGVLVLKRLADAEADGDRIDAVLLGSAVNQDGASTSIAAPSAAAQVAVIEAALEQAGLEPDALTVLEAHGTGTRLGDQVELAALSTVFGGRKADAPRLRLSSVKTAIGHAEAAAGVAGLIRIILSMQHQRHTPHLQFKRHNEGFDWDAHPFDILPEGGAWPRGEQRRIAGVSSFGISGTNAHIIVGEAPRHEAEPAQASVPAGQALLLSGHSESALAATAKQWAAKLSAANVPLGDACAIAAAARAQLHERLAVVADTGVAMAEALTAAAAGEDHPSVRRGVCFARPRIVFAFPGQGCQYPGMGRAFYETQPAFAEAFDRACDALRPHMDVDPKALVFDAGAASLDDTRYSQPAIFAVETALAALWKAWGLTPDAVLGHSFGEYAAAHTAGVMSLADAARLVCARARLAADCPSAGGMAAVALGVDALAPLLKDRPITVAADNAPDATTLAGPREALAALIEEVVATGAKATMLDISHPFHSPLMAPIVDAFAAEVATVALAPPQCLYASTVTGTVDNTAPTDPATWAEQIVAPVKFRGALAAVQSALSDDEEAPTLIIECGPRPVLMPVARKSLERAQWLPTMVPGPDSDAVTAEAIAELFVSGVRLDGRALQGNRSFQRLDLPGTAFERTRHWIDVAPPGEHADAPISGSVVGRARSLADGTRVARGRLSERTPRWLEDHLIGGKTILPGAALIDAMARAAGTSALSHVALMKPVGVPVTGTLELEAVCRDGAIRLFTRTDDADAPWAEMATARTPSAAAAFPQIPSPGEGAETISGQALRAAVGQVGLFLGPTYRVLQSLRVDGDHAEGTLSAPAAALRRIAMLDGAFQAALALQGIDSALTMPFAIEHIALPEDLPQTVHCRVALRSEAGHAAFDIALEGSDGAKVGLITGLVLRPASEAAAPRAYEFMWERKGRTTLPRSAEFMPSPVDVMAKIIIRPRTNAWELNTTLSRAADAAAWSALEASVGPLAPGVPVPPADQVPADRRRILDTITARLVSAKHVERREDGTLVTLEPPELGATEILDDLSARLPGAGPEIDLMRRTASALPEIIAGRGDGLEVLFPGGDLEPLAALYGRSISMGPINDAVVEVVARLQAALPPHRRLNVLEVGGGTGGTTEALLPLIDFCGIQYTFTDIGPRFVARAAERFAALDDASFQVFDLEGDDEPEGHHDLVIAVNVVHATADVGAALRAIAKRLAPGGHLLLVELTEDGTWLDLPFGLTSQWGEHRDKDRRPTSHLMAPRAWQDALADAGFGMCGVVSSDLGEPQQAILLAQRATVSPAATNGRGDHGEEVPSAVIVGELEGLAGRLSDTLSLRGVNARAVTPEGASALLAERIRLGHPPGLVVHTVAAEGTFRGAAAGEICKSLLEVSRATMGTTPCLVGVTAGAVSGDAVGTASRPEGGVVLGLMRALDTEVPDRMHLRVDIDPDITGNEAARLLADEILALPSRSAGPTESEVALRRAGRFVSRLRPMAPLPPAAGEGEQLQLDATPDGEPVFMPVPRETPGPGKVEIAVKGAGIAFTDMLQAMGTSMLERTLYGIDLTGVVSQVGEGVERLKVGDRVAGVADGALAQYAYADQRVFTPLLEGLDGFDAAATASSWITVRYSLDRLAGLKKGENVLIHSAAGGVGMLAVQLARARGCRVFATAHPGKWPVVWRAGVSDVFNSRQTDFGEAILERTNGEGVGIVLNALTSEAAMKANLLALAPNGRLVELGKRSAWDAEKIAAVRPDVTHYHFDFYSIFGRWPEALEKPVEGLVALLAKGAIKPPRGGVFRAQDVGRAFALMRRGHNIGKPVVIPPPVRGNPFDQVAADAGSVLITGGLGGLGRSLTAHLIAKGVKRFALVSHRPVRPDETAYIDELRSGGAAVELVVADISTADGVREGLDAARALGPLRAVIHMAGRLSDRHHAQLPFEEFSAVLGPKLSAAWHLHEQTREDDLVAFIAFGSLAAVMGNAGQTAHAAASAGLDALACHRASLGLPATVLDLGRVAEVGAAASEEIATDLAARGVDGMSVEAVIDALEAQMRVGNAQTVFAAVRWPKHLEGVGLGDQLRFEELAERPTPATPQEATNTEAGNAKASNTEDAGTLYSLLAETLGVPAIGLRLDTPLVLAGLDSLMAVDLRDKINRQFDAEVTLTTLIGGITPRRLADALRGDAGARSTQ